MSEFILELKNINKSFNGLKLIDNLSMAVEKNTFSAILGSNGVGKTSLFNIIGGYIHPDKGRIEYKGNDITGLPPWKRAQSGLGRLYQDIRIFHRLSLIQNLIVTYNDDSENLFNTIFGSKNGKEKNKIETAIKWLNFVGLAEMKDRSAGNLSWGQQKLLSFARLLCADFDVLLLDEPVSGVNPAMVDIIIEKIKAIKDLGKTIIAVEHNIGAVKAMSLDKIFFMDSGKIKAMGKPDEILNNKEIMDIYLGV